jgi:predicted N-acetyltransferase YhbS
MNTATYRVRQAVPADRAAVLSLIEEAAQWLRGKDTKQWDKPWPSRPARDGRVTRGITNGLTWVVEDDSGEIAATVTYRERGSRKLWRKRELAEPACYVSRLVVRRSYAGRRIGAGLTDWAGMRGAEQWGALYIRVDVWTDNYALHSYYKEHGFEYIRTVHFDDPWEYPSAALFEKAVTKIDKDAASSFKEV